MIGFEYKYATLPEIMRNIKLLTEYSLLESFTLIVFIFFVILIIYYIVPICNIYIQYNTKEHKKEERRLLLKQIVMQKDINDEIEKEINLK